MLQHFLLRKVLAPRATLQSLDKNAPEWAIAYLAVLYTGAVVVPIDYQLTTSELINLIQAGDVNAAFIDEEKFKDIQAKFPDMPCFGLSKAVGEYIYDLKPPKDFVFSRPHTPAKNTAAILLPLARQGSQKASC